jgi:hypothetical protein
MRKIILALAFSILLAPGVFPQSRTPPPQKSEKKETQKGSNTKPVQTEQTKDEADIDAFIESLRVPKPETLEWVEAASTEDYQYLFNTRRILRTGADILRVWIKRVPLTDKGWQSSIRSDARYKNYAHTLVLEEFDCLKKRERVLFFSTYDTSGKVIDSADLEDEAKWQSAPPGTVLEEQIDTACSYVK